MNLCSDMCFFAYTCHPQQKMLYFDQILFSYMVYKVPDMAYNELIISLLKTSFFHI